jgi:predicted flap endonuclease-1-like 5' DNA nuclease
LEDQAVARDALEAEVEAEEAEVDDDAAWLSEELEDQGEAQVEDRREDADTEPASGELPTYVEAMDEPGEEPAPDPNRATDDHPATATPLDDDEWASSSRIHPLSDDNRLGMRRPLLVGDAVPAEPRRSAASDSRRPATILQPRNGVPDNLQRIKGIGERNEVRLNQLGIFHFSQIASWTPAEVRWVGEQLAFPERIEDDDWVGQAVVLASGGETGFTKSAERRRSRRRTAREAAPEQDPEDQT